MTILATNDMWNAEAQLENFLNNIRVVEHSRTNEMSKDSLWNVVSWYHRFKIAIPTMGYPFNTLPIAQIDAFSTWEDVQKCFDAIPQEVIALAHQVNNIGFNGQKLIGNA